MQQQQQQRLNQVLMQQALLQQQQQQQQPPLYPNPGLLAGSPQIEPILSGNLPPGFDPSTCRSVYVGNVHNQVGEALLQEVFASCGPVEGCKLIRKEKDWDRQNPTQIVTEMCGFVTILSGTFLLHKTKDMNVGHTQSLSIRLPKTADEMATLPRKASLSSVKNHCGHRDTS